MAIFLRAFLPLLAALVLVLLWNVPGHFGWNVDAANDWLATLQLMGPVIAAATAAAAARLSRGRAATAWKLFAAGSLLYVFGNLFYITVALADGVTSFPTLPEAAYFVMAILFAAGIGTYAKPSSNTPAVIFYNFVLLYGAVVVCCLFLLHHAIKNSQLGEFATIVAFLYPALWCSVAVFACALLVLYPHGRRRVPLLLLTLAFAAEAAADVIYALQLMADSYDVGGWPHMLWMISAFLLSWAAAEHMLIAREPDKIATAETESPDNSLVQAMTPAVILFAILVAGSFTGAFGTGIYRHFSGALAIILAGTVALREFWIVETRKRLLAVAADRAAKLVATGERLASVLESTSDSVLVVDREWRIRYFNQRALGLIPELERHGLGHDFWGLIPPEFRETYEGPFRASLETGEPWLTEIYDDVHGLWLDLRVYPSPEGLSFFFRDISEQRRIHDELEHLAHHDFLTGLSNRAIFRQKLDVARAASSKAGVLLLDLDEFKEINDTLGHAVGDAVLVQVAERLRRCAPPGSVVARLGGDEYAILLDGDAIERLVELGRAIRAELSRPCEADGHAVVIGASIGMSCGVADGSLFMKADIALFEAKTAKRGDVVIFEPEMEARLRDRKALLNDLSQAIENGELELAYQPLLDVRSRRTVGFEALLRWRRPQHGMTAPDVFIPLAEESGLIVPIGEWALRTACSAAVHWPDSVSLSVNLSTRQFADEQFIDRIVNALQDSGLDHRRLELEVTESALLHEHNLPLLRGIQDLGIRIALDDFGTGYSSLSYLQRFRFNKLKIDRSFIEGVPERRQSVAIVKAVVQLARTLGMRITAEGVETQAQFDWIAANCDEVQGWFVSRPMPAADIPAYLAAEERRMGTRRRA